jgi:molybdopterin molybdotransferase
VSTGDELVPPGTALRRGQIPDSNSWLLAAAVREAGGEAVRIGPVPDDVEALRTLLTGLDVDAIVTSGGVSVGAYDVVKAALRDLPDVEFVAVAVQPGKPQGLGRLPGGTPIYTLPGNPVSSFASFEMFVRPAILRMRGLHDVERPTVTVLADDGWTTPPGRAQLMPVRWVGPDRVARATVRGSGSHLVARLALAEGLAVIPAEVSEVAAGDHLTVLRVSP